MRKMICGFETLFLRMTFAVVSMLWLTGCQAQTRPEPFPRNVEVVEALCDAWKKSLATWADADTEQTKDEVDKAIRVQEAACDEATP